MLFALSGYDWVQIIGAISLGIVGVINAYYAKRADTKIDTAARISANTAKVVTEKLDDAAAKAVDSNQVPRALLDTNAAKQLREIHSATNGEMSRRFDQIDRDNNEIKAQNKELKTYFAQLDQRISHIETNNASPKL